MRLFGPAGNLEVELIDLVVNDEFISLSTQMGVWQQTVLIDYKDTKKLMSLFFRFSIILFLFKSFFRSLFNFSEKSD
ncbi:MAG: hypothetical protein ACR2NW_09490 [Thermodesulfobacteriota bacterium]